MKIDLIPGMSRKLYRDYKLQHLIFSFHSYPYKPISAVGFSYFYEINNVWYPKGMSVSFDWCKVLDEDEVERLIKHEIAHLLSPHGTDHGQAWVDNCAKVGIEPEVKWFSRRIPDIAKDML